MPGPGSEDRAERRRTLFHSEWWRIVTGVLCRIIVDVMIHRWNDNGPC